MDVPNLPSPPPGSSDIFSLKDHELSDGLQFIEEIGFGNWGSVWLCRTKRGSSSLGSANVSNQKIAVKLVHRSKTPTTAARVKSLWNEMKIVRTFKFDPHPSIIPFHSFIITPSYALITMAYLPTLVPVEVDEIKARDWFRFLLSGVNFLHRRGVVHNDIKPANILVSHKNIPVLVDFGFAEKYDLESTTAFHSNLAYGTPEYLSPERARGLPHDTRKSDVWSLGVTFFEILVGRTPFEHCDGEQFSSKDDLERYWQRTLRGKWIGEWKMTKPMEKMIRRMMSPNADLRCTTTQAMNDPYWVYRKDSTSHRRSSSYTSSIVFEKDMSKLITASRQWMDDELPDTPPGLDLVREPSKEHIQIPELVRVKSQSKIAVAKAHLRKRVPPVGDLSPVKASPPSSPFSTTAGKENIRAFNAAAAGVNAARKPLGNISHRGNVPESRLVPRQSLDLGKDARKSRVLGDSTTRHRNSENTNDNTKRKEVVKAKKDPVRDRVKQWERERERMREMERLEEIQRERDETFEREQEESATTEKEKEQSPEKEDAQLWTLPVPVTSPIASPVASSFTTGSSSGPGRSSANDNSSLSAIRHNIRKSIDKTVQMYKSSALVQRSTSVLGLPADLERISRRASHGARGTSEDDVQNVPATLPSVRQAAHDGRVAADARMDRMTIWMRNVEKVVEDARQNFASSSAQELTTLPSLPVAPLSRSHSRTNRSSRLPRRVLAANEIFNHENDQTQSAVDFSNITGTFATVNDMSVACSQLQLPEIHTPSRRRRATVSICSPGKVSQTPLDIIQSGSPSKRREKSRSHGNLLQLHIAPVSMLEAELNKPDIPTCAHRLSEVLDGSLFIAPPLSPRPPSSPSEEDIDLQDMSIIQGSASFNDLTSSPLHVEPYPSRKPSIQSAQHLDSPSQRRIEGVYDRFLMATSGVKRLGKGYQSDNAGPVCNPLPPTNQRPEGHRLFHSTRKMPPPVSSEDQRRTVSVDELGVISHAAEPSSSTSGGHTVLKDDGNTTVALVRRAMKAIVPIKTSRRVSRAA